MLSHNHHRLLTVACGVLLSAAAGARAQDAISEETLTFFGQNCASCHTIGGGRLTGPDLKGVTERRETQWLVDFLLDPKGVIDSGDPYAVQLLKDARGVYMPPAPGMNRALAEKLVALIASESAAERSRFAGLQISDRPLTEQDVIAGRALFEGRTAFAAGAPACTSCHTTADVGALGGGRLGPDLSAVYARLEGRKSLSAWLAAPPSPVMSPVYKGRALESEEILALVAYLESNAKRGVEAAEPATLTFVMSGVGLSALLLVLFDLLWRNRFRSVRRSLVSRS